MSIFVLEVMESLRVCTCNGLQEYSVLDFGRTSSEKARVLRFTNDVLVYAGGCPPAISSGHGFVHRILE